MSFRAQPFTLQDTRDWMEKSIRSYHERGHGRWAVILRENNGFTGDAGIMFATVDEKIEYDLGYIISSIHWGKGFAAEAAAACKSFGFDKLKIKRLCANMPACSRQAGKPCRVYPGSREDRYEKGKSVFNRRNQNILMYLYSTSNTKTWIDLSQLFPRY